MAPLSDDASRYHAVPPNE